IPMLFRKFVGDFAERYKSQPVQLDEPARQLLMSYGWPGNVRELKNIAEQISVLSKDKIVNANQLTNFLPNRENNTRMPVVASQQGNNAPATSFSGSSDNAGSSTTEREILYTLFFD